MNPADPGGLLLDFGGLVLELSSPTANGDVVTWAALTLSGQASAKLTWEDGRIQTQLDVKVGLDISDEPVFPIDEEPFETFLTTLAQGLPSALTDQLAQSALTFDSLDAFGVRIERLEISAPANAPTFMRFGVKLGLR